MNKTKQKQTHKYREQIVGSRGERGGGRGKIGEGNLEVHTARYKIHKLQGCM